MFGGYAFLQQKITVENSSQTAASQTSGQAKDQLPAPVIAGRRLFAPPPAFNQQVAARYASAFLSTKLAPKLTSEFFETEEEIARREARLHLARHAPPPLDLSDALEPDGSINFNVPPTLKKPDEKAAQHFTFAAKKTG